MKLITVFVLTWLICMTTWVLSTALWMLVIQPRIVWRIKDWLWERKYLKSNSK